MSDVRDKAKESHNFIVKLCAAKVRILAEKYEGFLAQEEDREKRAWLFGAIVTFERAARAIEEEIET